MPRACDLVLSGAGRVHPPLWASPNGHFEDVLVSSVPQEDPSASSMRVTSDFRAKPSAGRWMLAAPWALGPPGEAMARQGNRRTCGAELVPPSLTRLTTGEP